MENNMSNEILNLNLIEIAHLISTGEITSLQATQITLDAIEKHNPNINAYLSVFNEQAIEQAKKVDAKIANKQAIGPLAGVPIAVKDNMCTAFGTTTCASKILENFHSPYNATVIEKLLAADAVIVGKTNLDEFAMGSSTENSGFVQTKNPWDTQRVPGGSSGGSAAAVAARMCYAALGSDTGGSIRQPASFCGIVGLKPTYGRVSRYGLVAYGSSLDQIGPMTRTVGDAALMMNVIAGHDERDSTSVNADLAPVADYKADLCGQIKNLKIGIVTKFNEGATPDVCGAIQDAIAVYKSMGAEIIEIDMPHFDYSIATYYIVATAEASSNLARYDGVHYGYRNKDADELVQMYSKSRAEGFGQEVKRRIMLGTYVLSSGYYDAYYLKALKVRNLIRSDYTNAFEKCDCIMMPVAPSTAFKFGEKTADPLQMYLSDIYTIAANLAGVPGISIPCGYDSQNLPIGLQIFTPAFTEHKILKIAAMYEKNTNFPKLPEIIINN
jgi:aspartyl-tRNA(Asn)/glutamyl-tRNA(Gln) amidotransferase subunit A